MNVLINVKAYDRLLIWENINFLTNSTNVEQSESERIWWNPILVLVQIIKQHFCDYPDFYFDLLASAIKDNWELELAISLIVV